MHWQLHAVRMQVRLTSTVYHVYYQPCTGAGSLNGIKIAIHRNLLTSVSVGWERSAQLGGGAAHERQRSPLRNT